MTMRVVEQLRVSPPQGSVPDSSLPLTFLDLIWVFADPVHRLILYPFPHSTAHFVDSLLPQLKSSLSLVLKDFYPLAGNLFLSDPLEIRYTDGDSVSVTVAEYDDHDDPNLFEKLCGSDPFDFNKFQQLIPQLSPPTDMETPVLVLQVTVFPNHGISLCITFHHTVCDGLSFNHFLKSWASACASRINSVQLPPPLMDRALIVDPRDLYSLFLSSIRQITTEKPDATGLTEIRDDYVLATFTLNGDHIQSLREFVTSKAQIPHCSTFVLACGFTWACLVKARRLESDRRVFFGFSADYRNRVSPPIPASYFGSCLGIHFGVANVGDLIGEDGLVAASEAISRGIEGLKDGLWEGVEWWGLATLKNGHSSAHTEELLTVAGSAKFGIYGLDFGWGRPRKVAVPSIINTKGMSLAESREGGGGVEIGLVLQRHVMEEFATRFTDDLNAVTAAGGV